MPLPAATLKDDQCQAEQAVRDIVHRKVTLRDWMRPLLTPIKLPTAEVQGPGSSVKVARPPAVAAVIPDDKGATDPDAPPTADGAAGQQPPDVQPPAKVPPTDPAAETPGHPPAAQPKRRGRPPKAATATQEKPTRKRSKVSGQGPQVAGLTSASEVGHKDSLAIKFASSLFVLHV